MALPRTSRITSLTRRIRAVDIGPPTLTGIAAGLVTKVLEAQQPALERATVADATLDEALHPGRAIAHLPVPHQGAEQGRPLPGVVSLDLCHRGPEAPPQLVLEGLQLLALLLQVPRLPEVEMHLRELDEGVHARLLESLLDPLRLEELEHVALLDIGEAVEHDAALEALLDLSDV